VVFALTASGGEHIPSALAQVLFGLAGGASQDDAVAAPRIRVPAGGGLWLEPGSDETLVAALRARGHHVRSDLPATDGVQLVVRGARLEATVDARKGGAAAVRR
jgi:gamma-glutamyltranspeptidase